MQTLKSLLADDIPVIVLTSMIKQLRKGHYRVIIGFDEARKQMIFHDPYFGPRRAMSYADFERNWNLGEDRNTKGWALAIVPEESRIRSARVRNDPLTQINLAAAYYRRGEYSRAALEWRAAGEKMAGDPAPLYSLGMIHLRAKDYDLAAEYARQAIRVDPRCAAGHDVLGLALHQKGEIREALASLGRALRLDRKSDYVRKHYLQVRDSYISWSKTPREGRKTQEEAPR
jgi:tetratricopeptide (TPR) repeat protein